MKKRLMIYVLLSLLLSPCEAQQKMRDVFLQMPDSLLPYLTENNRLDFLDFMDSNMKAEVTNELGGKSEMLSLSDSALAIQVSPAMRVAMRLMPVTEAVDSCQQVVCVISTYGKDAPESQLAVYSVRWRPLLSERYLSGLPRPPYEASFVEGATSIRLKGAVALDPIAYEEQQKTESWLKNIEWIQ
ncbi:MAG: DUF3256 family protein [Prevotella sp.]|nr:DUF3256 family protein [Prevotella sp.]